MSELGIDVGGLRLVPQGEERQLRLVELRESVRNELDFRRTVLAGRRVNRSGRRPPHVAEGTGFRPGHLGESWVAQTHQEDLVVRPPDESALLAIDDPFVVRGLPARARLVREVLAQDSPFMGDPAPFLIPRRLLVAVGPVIVRALELLQLGERRAPVAAVVAEHVLRALPQRLGLPAVDLAHGRSTLSGFELFRLDAEAGGLGLDRGDLVADDLDRVSSELSVVLPRLGQQERRLDAMRAPPRRLSLLGLGAAAEDRRHHLLDRLEHGNFFLPVRWAGESRTVSSCQSHLATGRIIRPALPTTVSKNYTAYS